VANAIEYEVARQVILIFSISLLPHFCFKKGKYLRNEFWL